MQVALSYAPSLRPGLLAEEVLAEDLVLVAGAPRFPFPVRAVWRDDLDPGLQEMARDCLLEVAREADLAQDELIGQLDELNGASDG